jgi:hypothetical protein
MAKVMRHPLLSIYKNNAGWSVFLLIEKEDLYPGGTKISMTIYFNARGGTQNISE